MKIQIGEIYLDKVTAQRIIHPNRTRDYLLPCLKEYGEEFTNKINNVFKVAVGLGDIVLTKRKTPEAYARHIFILLDAKVAKKFFIDFVDWIKDQPMYEDDYVFDDIRKSHYHMVILKFPERFYDSFETFKAGKYSKMFNPETISKFFEKFPDVQKVLIKDSNYKITFTKKLNKWLGNKNSDRIKPEEWEGELDFPPKEDEEVFNTHLKKKNGN